MCGTKVFGVTLKVLCERTGTEVPHLLASILRTLASSALSIPGVFAHASKCATVNQLKYAVESSSSVTELLEATDPPLVGSLLKRWLQELPDPLLDWHRQVEFLSACKEEASIEKRIANLNDAVAQVDPVTLGTLKPLLLFLQQYCFRQRRFDQQLLQVAVEFAPILFPAALAAGPVELRLAEETVATLVSNALHVFNPALAANVPVVTPQALCEAAAEIMDEPQQPEQRAETQQQQGHGRGTFLTPVHISQQNAGPQAPELVRGSEACDEPYEPYMNDPEFLTALDVMVTGCVTSALFSSDDDDCDLTQNAIEDDCASITSSLNTLSSSAGGAVSSSSGGASSCSTVSEPVASTAAAHRRSSNGGHRQPYHQHYHRHSDDLAPRQQREVSSGGVADPPYSPRTELVPPPPVDLMQTFITADAAATIARATTAKAKTTKGSSAVVLADLSQHESADGSVICIISAQSGTGKAAQQHGASTAQQPPALADVGPTLLGSSRKDAHTGPGSRRPTEGGAGSTGGAADARAAGHGTTGHGHGSSARSGCRTQQSEDGPQRRMSMGGNSNASGSNTQALTHQPAASKSASASAQPQRRQTMGGVNDSSGSRASGGGGNRTSTSCGGAASSRPTSPGIPLGVAGYLGVSLTASHTLEVRELATADAAAHRLPIRGLSAAAMQAEKERLKRQLKDVAAAYEAMAGRPLTPALKEPLRPVYVRYHKIKALLAAGGAGTAGAAAGGVGRREGAVAMGAAAVLQKQVVLTAPPNAVTV